MKADFLLGADALVRRATMAVSIDRVDRVVAARCATRTPVNVDARIVVVSWVGVTAERGDALAGGRGGGVVEGQDSSLVGLMGVWSLAYGVDDVDMTTDADGLITVVG